MPGTDTASVLDPHVLIAILSLLPALIVALGIVLHDLFPDDRNG